jgi:hypothetical protein
MKKKEREALRVRAYRAWRKLPKGWWTVDVVALVEREIDRERRRAKAQQERYWLAQRGLLSESNAGWKP